MLVRIEPLKSFIAARSLLSFIGTTTILTRRGSQNLLWIPIASFICLAITHIHNIHYWTLYRAQFVGSITLNHVVTAQITSASSRKRATNGPGTNPSLLQS
jgi:hypothetical protein